MKHNNPMPLNVIYYDISNIKNCFVWKDSDQLWMT